MLQQQIILDKILEELRNLAQTKIPYLDLIRSSGYGGSNFHMIIPEETRFYSQSPYYYKDELRFIHWTKIENLVSIINTGEIRLYNLINSEDEDEFNYAADTLRLEPAYKAWVKDNYFTFSFCKIDNLNDPFLWRKHGSNYSGIAFEFSIQNKIDDWNNYFISNVYYSLPKEFSDFDKDFQEINTRYNNTLSLVFDIWKFAGFHKKSTFKDENEVRIGTCFPFKYADDKFKIARKEFRITGNRNRIVTYIPLKLWINFEDKNYPKEFYSKDDIKKYNEDLSTKPQIKIENIFFGENCGLSIDEFYKFREALTEMISFQLGYHVDIVWDFVKP